MQSWIDVMQARTIYCYSPSSTQQRLCTQHTRVLPTVDEAAFIGSLAPYAARWSFASIATGVHRTRGSALQATPGPFQTLFPGALHTPPRNISYSTAVCCLSLLQVPQHSGREALYKELTESPGVIWATSEVGSRRIDEINILEATKEAMTVSLYLVTLSFFLLPGRLYLCRRVDAY